MEISEGLKKLALIKSENSSDHNVILGLVKRLESESVKDILRYNDNQSIHSIIHDICVTIRSDVNNQTNNKKEIIDSIAKIIKIGREYLLRALKNSDLKSLLIFVLINNQLKYDIENLLEDLSIKKEDINITKKSLKIIQKYEVGINTLKDTPYYEKEFISDYHKGVKSLNISQAYGFLIALERSGKMIGDNLFFNELSAFQFKVDFDNYADLLEKLEEPIQIKAFLNNLKVADIERITNNKKLQNRWLNFEVINQLIDKSNNNELNESTIDALKQTLERIKENDFNFLSQTIEFYEKEKIFNAALGKLFNSLNKTQTKLIIDGESINKYCFKLESKIILLEYISKSCLTKKIDLINGLFYAKWREFFNSLYQDKDFFTIELIITDYINFVINYYVKNFDKKDIVSVINKLIDKISFIESKWVHSISQQKSNVLLYFSELYILSFVFEQKQIQNKEIPLNYERLINNEILKRRYIEGSVLKKLEHAKSNFNWINKKEKK